MYVSIQTQNVGNETASIKFHASEKNIAIFWLIFVGSEIAIWKQAKNYNLIASRRLNLFRTLSAFKKTNTQQKNSIFLKAMQPVLVLLAINYNK